MKKYEITFVIGEKFNEIQAKEIAKDTRKFLESHGAKIDQEVFWGKRKLAYKIDKNSFGYYFVMTFDLDPAQSAVVIHDLNLNEKILRYIFANYIEPTSFYEENTGDGKKREERTEKTRSKPAKETETYPNKTIDDDEKDKIKETKKKPKADFGETEEAAEDLNKDNDIKGVAEDAITKSAESSQEELDSSEKDIEAKTDDKADGFIDDSREKEKAEPKKATKKEAVEEKAIEEEEEKPRAKLMTEEERKEQLEKKLAELLKDE